MAPSTAMDPKTTTTTETSSIEALDTLDVLDDVLLSPPLLAFPAEDSSTSSSGSSSQHSESPRNDWTMAWTQDTKDPLLDDLGNFSMDWTGLDMDTSMSTFLDDQSGDQLSIDPSALHFPGDSMFQFTLAPPDAVCQPLQLPTPKAGSNSSRSTSPTPVKSERDSGAGVNLNDLNLFGELSQKARDASGVVLAIPAERSQAPISPVSPVSPAPVPPSRVPIPRLRPANAAVAPLSVKSTTSPATHPTPPASVPASSPMPAPLVTEKTVRPKTSHTTIERRYRTNLNARILALRRAVPALRILEKNNPSQTQGKGLTGATAPKWDFDDVINERGYVDGVKAAKKNSKGVVLGKAVEYIRALKRRETRLRRESEGLRALLSGLVGGPELLREWEREWHSRFGGEEADEVDEDEDDADIDVDGDDCAGEEESDGDDVRAKKRARTTKPAAPASEKRKRGRPRKHPAPPTVPAVPMAASVSPATIVPTSTSKSLLAFVLVFSLFRPNATPVGNTGAVLTAAPEVQAPGWSALQALHIIVSVLLLVSLVGAYLPRSVARVIPDVLIFTTTLPSPLHMSAPQKESLPVRDEHKLRAALGAEGTVFGVVRAVITRMLRLRLRGDLRAWRRIGEFDVVRGSTAPLLSRMQTYFALTAHAPSAPAERITLALLARTFAPTSAAVHWENARRAENSTATEKLVLEMDMDDAAHVLAAAVTSSSASSPVSSGSSNASDSEDDANTSSSSPVRLIATHAVLARAKALAGDAFVAAVTGTYPDASSDDAAAVHAASRELGGEPAALIRLLERVTRGETLPVLEASADADADADGDAGAVRTLLRATLLFRRAFSLRPGQKNAALHLQLRRALASPAFDMSPATEEARDQVVDMLAEARRAR